MTSVSHVWENITHITQLEIPCESFAETSGFHYFSPTASTKNSVWSLAWVILFY